MCCSVVLSKEPATRFIDRVLKRYSCEETFIAGNSDVTAGFNFEANTPRNQLLNPLPHRYTLYAESQSEREHFSFYSFFFWYFLRSDLYITWKNLVKYVNCYIKKTWRRLEAFWKLMESNQILTKTFWWVFHFSFCFWRTIKPSKINKEK